MRPTATTAARVSARISCRLAIAAWLACALAVGNAAAAPPAEATAAVRPPTGPADLPDELPGRWRISLCVSDSNDHAWIRFENPENGSIRSIGRYHLLVGGWFDRAHLRWNYAPTLRTGLHMDREQGREADLADGSEILRTAWVENPRIYVARGPRGHALVRNNCATYARDAWHF
ncbi:MAG: hypothetical protein JNG89_13425, partial [Planctomycetaceae bacterium]|nr:hypothetical protein [Planctomycetaceae bacterium]